METKSGALKKSTQHILPIYQNYILINEGIGTKHILNKKINRKHFLKAINKPKYSFATLLQSYSLIMLITLAFITVCMIVNKEKVVFDYVYEYLKRVLC